MQQKSRDAFRTISEVADWLDVPTHVLRFWESRFAQIKPVKRAGGRRYYRPSDMRLIGGIKVLLHDEGNSIRDVQKMIREEGVKHVGGFSPALDGPDEAAASDASTAAPDPAPPPTTPAPSARRTSRALPDPEPEDDAHYVDERQADMFPETLSGAATPEPDAPSEPDAKAEPDAPSEPDAAPEPEAQSEPDATPDAETAPDPVAAQQPAAAPKPAASPEPPVATPEPSAAAAPAADQDDPPPAPPRLSARLWQMSARDLDAAAPALREAAERLADLARSRRG